MDEVAGEVLFSGNEPDAVATADNADEFAAKAVDASVDCDALTVELELAAVAGLSVR